MPFDPARAKSLFLTASEMTDFATRAAFLDRECGADAELRERVEALLRANDDGTLPTVVASTMASASQQPRSEGREDSTAQVGAVIAGKYTLGEVIGEGGMGSVWKAKQSEPVKRYVALKLIKAGMDSRQVLARFNAERQALAMMDHPNIAKVLDGGLHEQRPYFVMELVKGVPITEYCDSHRLTPQQRLELFVPVCQAIQHAHQKGIIHRDIKPSNVLVALYDERPVVKVIDFGVAKATGAALTEVTLETGFGNIVGTPEYMSPEQATFNNLDIDTRSDVYALGVLLYELLTGTPPFSKRDLEKKGLLEMLRVVREEEPQRPSTKLSTADALPTLSANRGTEPAKLTGLLRNELDWIVMKALEKDRTRRYETANGFAADVQRYLSGEPVLAHPPSTAYRLKKFVRRNRPQVIAASLVLLALVAGIAGTTLGLLEARQQTEIARQEARLKEQARADEAKQRAIAEDNEQAANTEKANSERARQDEERERKFAEAIAQFVKDDFLGLTSVEGQERFGGEFGSEGLDRNATLMDLLNRAASKLNERKDLDPRIEAELCWIVGVNYRGSGEAAMGVPFLERAVELRRSALGIEHVDTLDAMNSLAVCYSDAGQRDKALPIHEQTLKLQQENLGVDHLHTLNTMRILAGCYEDAGQLSRSLSLYEQTLELTKKTLGPHHQQTLKCMNDLAVSYFVAKQYEKALPLFEQALALKQLIHGEDHQSTLSAMTNLADCYRVSGQPQKAVPMFEQSFKRLKVILGPRHPATRESMRKLATGYRSAGQLQSALPLIEQEYEFNKEKLGPHHPQTLQAMAGLAASYSQTGQLEKAIPLFEQTLELQKKHLGTDHLDTITTMNNLAQQGYHAARQFDKSVPLQEAALEAVKRKRGPDHPHTLSSMTNLGTSYLAIGKVELALPLYEQAYQVARVKLGPDDRYTLAVMRQLGVVYGESGQIDKAVPLLEEALKLFQAKFGADNFSTLDTMGHLVRTYEAGGQFEKAELLHRENVSFVKTKSSGDSPDYAAALAQLGQNLLSQKKMADAEPIVRECLSLREQHTPDDWRTFNTKSMLGGALLGQKKYADAEQLLLDGYEGMKKREATIPEQGKIRLPEALDRLIELSTATDKPDEVRRWQAERVKYPPPVVSAAKNK